MARSSLIYMSVAASLAAGGCAGVSPPVLPELPDITEALALSDDNVVGSATEVYARVAREAMACWFGSEGPLKADYVYHAEAAPASRGGKSVIVIHERDRQSVHPEGLRAFRIAIMPQDETARVSIENLKLPESLAKALEHDVRRWAAGAIGCADGKEQWSPRPIEPQEDPDTWKSRTKPSGRRT